MKIQGENIFNKDFLIGNKSNKNNGDYKLKNFFMRRSVSKKATYAIGKKLPNHVLNENPGEYLLRG